MQSAGRRQISAPKAGTTIGVALLPASTSTQIYANGDSIITTAVAVAATEVEVLEQRGFIVGDVVRLGYGTGNEEEVTVSAVDAASGAGTVTFTATPATKAHVINEPIVEKEDPIRPGSLDVLSSGTTVATDDGLGVLVGVGAETGTVDYTTGAVNIDMDSSSSRTITYNCDKLDDKADIDDLDGDGFLRNMQVMKFMRRDAPDYLGVKNLGTTQIGFVVEKSNNNGFSFTEIAGKSGTLSGLARNLVNLPGLLGTDYVRIRATAASTGAGSVLEVDTHSVIDDNGQ